MAYEPKDEMEGAMWIAKGDDGQPKKDKNGHAYFDVSIDVRGVHFKAKAFRQDNEPGSKRPDYRIVLSKGQDQRGPAPTSANATDIPF